MSASLFSQLVVGPQVIPNRLALAPVKTALGEEDGKVSARHVAYYRRRAQGWRLRLNVDPAEITAAGREGNLRAAIRDGRAGRIRPSGSPSVSDVARL